MIHNALERRARSALHSFRERFGTRTVQDSTETVRGGNYLYLWQWAFNEQQQGRSAAVIRSNRMADWTAEFPLLQSLTVDRKETRLLDRRRFATRFFFDGDFDRVQNRDFCRALIASSASFRDRVESLRTEVDSETLVVNVRRGDYYSVPAYTRRFSLDIRSHVAEGLALARAAGRSVEDVLVVSDDVEWCMRELSDILDTPRSLRRRRSMFDDLAALAASRTLILANSTFSYWGSHLASSSDQQHLSIAPPYHELLPDGEPFSPMLDPLWPRTTRREQPE